MKDKIYQSPQTQCSTEIPGQQPKNTDSPKIFLYQEKQTSGKSTETHFSVLVQLGQVQATLLSLLPPVGVESEPDDTVPDEPRGFEVDRGELPCGELWTICHFVGSFGSC